MISKLKQARINQNLSVEDVATKLNIRRKYIIALEENRLEEIPGSVYVNGYIKMYCNYLMVPYSDVKSLGEYESLTDNIVEPIFRNVSSINRVSIAIMIMLTLAGTSWYYLSREVQRRNISLMEHLENMEPENYLTNSADVRVMNPALIDQDNNIADGVQEINYNLKTLINNNFIDSEVKN